MDWTGIIVIVAAVVVLCLVQLLTHAGSQPNDGKIACMMPKDTSAKGKDLKSERSLTDTSEKPESAKQ